MTRTAFYPGSFDPLTRGHVDIIRAAMSFCDTLVVAIGVHPTKKALLSAQERAGLIEAEANPIATALGSRVRIVTFHGLAVEAACQAGATLIVRGLRSGVDFEDEIVMAGMNRAMAPDLQTLFVPASIETRHITGTMVRQIAAMGGDISAFVPARVAALLARRNGRDAAL